MRRCLKPTFFSASKFRVSSRPRRENDRASTPRKLMRFEISGALMTSRNRDERDFTLPNSASEGCESCQTRR